MIFVLVVICVTYLQALDEMEVPLTMVISKLRQEKGGGDTLQAIFKIVRIRYASFLVSKTHSIVAVVH